MGCGVSKLEVPNGIATTARLHPHFHRRIEDFKRRRHARSLNKATPSKKVLLRHGPDEDVGEITLHRINPLFNNMQKNTYSPEEDESCVPSEGSKKPSEKIESLTVKDNERIVVQKVPLKGTIEGKEGFKKVEKAKNQNAEDGDEEDESRDDNNDERRIGHDKGIFPGSPSFRIYYTGNSDDDKNESDNEDQSKESTYYVQKTAQSKVALSSKDSTTRTAMKDGKTKVFRKVKMGK